MPSLLDRLFDSLLNLVPLKEMFALLSQPIAVDPTPAVVALNESVSQARVRLRNKRLMPLPVKGLTLAIDRIIVEHEYVPGTKNYTNQFQGTPIRTEHESGSFDLLAGAVCCIVITYDAESGFVQVDSPNGGSYKFPIFQGSIVLRAQGSNTKPKTFVLNIDRDQDGQMRIDAKWQAIPGGEQSQVEMQKALPKPEPRSLT